VASDESDVEEDTCSDESDVGEDTCSDESDVAVDAPSPGCFRIHESVEDTKLSTNKQHTLSNLGFRV